MLAQLPASLEHGGRTYDVSYRPTAEDGGKPQVLVVLSDVTDQLENQRREADSRETLSVFEHVTSDPLGFREFLAEGRALIEQVTSEQPSLQLLRALHTLKGNASLYGAALLASECHALEETLTREERAHPSAAERERLQAAWSRFEQRAQSFLREAPERELRVSEAEFDEALQALEDGAEPAAMTQRLLRWRDEPVEVRLHRAGEQARSVAERLGKPAPEVRIDAARVRLPAGEWSEFWASFAHVVGNAVDHGLEAPEEREAAGKPAAGRLELTAALEGAGWRVALRDDGRGIDWAGVREAAREAGLPHGTSEELEAALFGDGVTTRQSATETSGRGMGLAAARESCRSRGGHVTVWSEPGKGTRFTFHFPSTRGNGKPPAQESYSAAVRLGFFTPRS